MTKEEKHIIKSLPCDFHYKENLRKFMKFYDLSLSGSFDYIFDVFFTDLNQKTKLNELNKEFKK